MGGTLQQDVSTTDCGLLQDMMSLLGVRSVSIVWINCHLSECTTDESKHYNMDGNKRLLVRLGRNA